MAEEDLSIRIRIAGKEETIAASSDLGRALAVAGKDIEQGLERANRPLLPMLGNLRGLVAAAGGLVAFRTGARFIGEALGEARQYEAEQADLRATLEATGHAIGLNIDELNAQAAALEEATTRGGDYITTAQAMLLTFKEIGRDIFPEVTELALDMARKFGGDASSAAVQLGKALNDPIQGVAALRRVGVQLSDEQERQIQQFVRVGNVAGAQRVILAELASQIGGVERAYARTDSGRLERDRERWANIKEEIGRGLLPVVAELSGSVADVFEGLQDSGQLAAGIDTLGASAKVFADALTAAAQAALTLSQIAPARWLGGAIQATVESAGLAVDVLTWDQEIKARNSARAAARGQLAARGQVLDVNADMMPSGPLAPPRLPLPRQSASSAPASGPRKAPAYSDEVQRELVRLDAEAGKAQADNIENQFLRARAAETADFEARRKAYRQQLNEGKISEAERTVLVERTRRGHTLRLQALHTEESRVVSEALTQGQAEIEGIIADRSSNPFAKARILEEAEHRQRVSAATRAQEELRAALAGENDPGERARLEERLTAGSAVAAQEDRRSAATRANITRGERRELAGRQAGLEAQGFNPFAQFDHSRDQLLQSLEDAEAAVTASFETQLAELNNSVAMGEEYGARLFDLQAERQERLTALHQAGADARRRIDMNEFTARVELSAQMATTLLQAWGMFYSNSRKNAGLHKALATGEAIINTAVSVTKAFREYGPTPLGFVMAGLMGTLGAAQITRIQSQKFAQGGIVEGTHPLGDHTPVFANAGEMFLTRQQQGTLLAIASGRVRPGADSAPAPSRPSVSLTYAPNVTVPPGASPMNIHAVKAALLEDKEAFAQFFRENFSDVGLLP